ncbi:GNA1162 family protein [Brevundimonas diminuta]|uniref:GNA1162 family protein n=1 Tax=Brevundimonas diminuta TaxID=293 RepID=UPI003D9A307A
MRLRKMITLGAVAAGAALMTACVTAPTPKSYASLRAANPRSVLVVPALNSTVNVDAADYFVSTISRPVAERGYYVFPAYMVKRMLEDEGLSDAGLVHQADASRFGPLFGCDTVMFVEIQKWESQYVVISTSTNVEFAYTLKSCRTGEVLWSNNQALSYSPQASSSGNPLADLLVQAIVSAVEKAKPNYIPLTQQANLLATHVVGQGLPAGPYLPAQHQADQKSFPN